MKKILFLLIVLFTMSAVNVYATQYYGDVDNNGRINSVDYILIRKHILKIVTLDEDSLIRANINKDSKVNAADYILLRKMILNGETKVPIEEKVTPSITISPISKTYTGNVVEAGINSSIGTPVATYYSDSSCKTKTTTSNAVSIGGAPKEAGTYYVIVKVAKGTNYNEATSACTKAVVINRQYTVTYNPNGGSGSNTTQTVNYNTDWTTKSNIFTRNGYELAGWSTTASGGITHNLNKAQGKWTSTSNLTLYAVWKVKQYTVTYNPNGGSGSNTTQTVNYNTDWTTKTNIFTRDGYELAGWSTKSSGGVTHNLNKAQGKWNSTNNLTLYAVWNKVSQYVITEDSKYDGYTNVAEYNSATLKYRIIKYQGQDIVLIYVADPYMQLNGALATPDALHSLKAEDILANEIKNYSYEKKGMIAVNASFYSPTNNYNGTPWDGVVINHGKVVKETGITGATFGILPNGMLKTYWKETAARLSSEGIRNTFVFSSDTARDSSTVKTDRTQICQYDKNNFVLLSGDGMVRACGEQITTLTGCKTPYNLDGGGSRKLYYKTSGSSEMTKRYGGSRVIPDMLYFVEK